MNNKPVAIIPFTLPWDWSADYQKQTVLQLVKKGWHVIVYLDSHAHFFLKKTPDSFPKIPGVTFFQPQYWIPGKRFSFIEEINRCTQIAFLIWQYSPQAWWVFDPLFAPLTTFIRWIFPQVTTLYDCVDFHSHPLEKKYIHIKQHERRLVNNCDFLFVNSKSLQGYFSHLHEPHLVPYGFDIASFTPKISVPQKHHNQTVGYIGGINYRIDFDLLLTLAKNNRHWRFEFWGPIQKDSIIDPLFRTSERISSLFSLPNVFHNQTERRNLQSVLSCFSVGIIPYRRDLLFNQLCAPMKLWEYLYCGVPVVSTPLREIQSLIRNPQHSKNIALASNVQEWTAALENPPVTKSYPRSFWENISWGNKVSTILSIIESK